MCELFSILCDNEAVISCRPLTYISHESEDLLQLMPSMFLQDIRVSGTDKQSEQKQTLVRQCFFQELREQMRSRFCREYLGQLIQRQGQKDCELKVGDIVLVGCENLKRVGWPMAHVPELCAGRDERVRVVKVKTRNGILTRPVRKLYPLEVCSYTRHTII
ncbi:uncharacterized protein TNCV_1864331 [Trichonephila clavipes]|nr:uncharacterized protein TNCV_1864331 [Trichonephila clavipes]